MRHFLPVIHLPRRRLFPRRELGSGRGSLGSRASYRNASALRFLRVAYGVVPRPFLLIIGESYRHVRWSASNLSCMDCWFAIHPVVKGRECGEAASSTMSHCGHERLFDAPIAGFHEVVRTEVMEAMIYSFPEHGGDAQLRRELYSKAPSFLNSA